MPAYAIGLDYGTNSCRSLIIDLADGRELGSAVFPYPSGNLGILTDGNDANVARQNPQDYLDGAVDIVTKAISQARQNDLNFSTEDIVGMGIDTTGSTIIPVDEEGTPLAFQEKFKRNLDAHVWLWKDHTAHEEAAKITELASEHRPHYLAKCGGIYSSEWWWSKIWRIKTVAPDVFKAAHTFVEHCDWLPATLTGTAANPKRGICSAGHKAMFSDEWGGLPDKEFLALLDPALNEKEWFDTAYTADEVAGKLTAEWAQKLNLPEGLPVAVGAFDAHMGAVGAGVKEGTLTKVLGTSTCDIMVAPADKELADIPGVCGIVNGSVLPNYYGIEAGQSAVGDIFLWFVNHLVPDSYGHSMGEKFDRLLEEIVTLRPGQSGLLALDWNNGNRTILVDQTLTGLMLGQTLHTTAGEIYRALIEATAFGALTIINRIKEHGVAVDEVICTGGLSLKNPTLMQIYADIIGLPLKVSVSEQTCALGAAIFGAVAGGHGNLLEIQSKVTRLLDQVYTPDKDAQKTYAELFELYSDLHDAFGTKEWSGNLHHVMKRLLELKKA